MSFVRKRLKVLKLKSTVILPQRRKSRRESGTSYATTSPILRRPGGATGYYHRAAAGTFARAEPRAAVKQRQFIDPARRGNSLSEIENLISELESLRDVLARREPARSA